MDLIIAWACGLLRTLEWSIPGRFTSAPYAAFPGHLVVTVVADGSGSYSLVCSGFGSGSHRVERLLRKSSFGSVRNSAALYHRPLAKTIINTYAQNSRACSKS